MKNTAAPATAPQSLLGATSRFAVAAGVAVLLATAWMATAQASDHAVRNVTQLISQETRQVAQLPRVVVVGQRASHTAATPRTQRAA